MSDHRFMSASAVIVLAGLAMACFAADRDQRDDGDTATVIVLARHGASAFDPNAPQSEGQVPDPALSPQGRAEAAQLVSLARIQKVSAIVSSPLRRARETAQVVADSLHLGVTIDDDLAEFNAGDLFGRNWSVSPYREQFDSLLHFTDLRRPQGESAEELSVRAVRAVDRIAVRYDGMRILVVAHGLTNRVIAGYALGESVRTSVLKRAQPATRVYVLAWPPSRPAAVDSASSESF